LGAADPGLPRGYVPGLLGVVNCFIPEDFSKTVRRFNDAPHEFVLLDHCGVCSLYNVISA